MKKLPLALIAILTLSISAYFVSCKKETEQALLVPAVQKIRTSATGDWEISPNKSLLQYSVTFDQKLKPEFEHYSTDSSIMVTCRVKFKGQDKEVLLPYAEPFLGGVKYYFYQLGGGKPKIFFHNTAICDFSAGGVGPEMPMEQISFNFTKVEF